LKAVHLNVFPNIGYFNPILEIKFQNLMDYKEDSVAIQLPGRPLPSVRLHRIAAVALRKQEFFFGTGAILPDRELRITRRCLRDDLGRGTDADFEGVANHPIVKAFVRERREKFEGSSRVEPLESGKAISVVRHQHEHRGATWHDESHEVVWLVAYGRHASGMPGDFFPFCKGLDQAGALLPAAEDYEDLYRERDLRLARMLLVDPPLLLKRARESGKEEHAQIGGRFGSAVSVEFADEIEAISVAFDTRAENFYKTLPVILAAFVPSAAFEDWESLERMPARELKSHEIAFSYVGEIP
jgi:hypothetical protein